MEHKLTIVELVPTLHIYCSCEKWMSITPMCENEESALLTAAQLFEKHIEKHAAGYKVGAYKLGGLHKPIVPASTNQIIPVTIINSSSPPPLALPEPTIPLVEDSVQPPRERPIMLEEVHKVPYYPNNNHYNNYSTVRTNRRKGTKYYD